MLKKTAALVSQWQLKRSEIEADEKKREEQGDPERKREREVARWKEEQEKDNGDNPNFAPIKGDWRTRFTERQKK